MLFGRFFEDEPKTTRPQSFLPARNSREEGSSKGCMFSFFLLRCVECGFVSEWIVVRTLRTGRGHFVP